MLFSLCEQAEFPPLSLVSGYFSIVEVKPTSSSVFCFSLDTYFFFSPFCIDPIPHTFFNSRLSHAFLIILWYNCIVIHWKCNMEVITVSYAKTFILYLSALFRSSRCLQPEWVTEARAERKEETERIIIKRQGKTGRTTVLKQIVHYGKIWRAVLF